ncbi:MAG: PLDc N-terminal domain-containing protein [Alphaproteobacteria bacterium]|jgi:hypothetical protein
MEYGFFGLLILALDIWAIIKIVQGQAAVGVKIAWIVVILLLPLLGLLAWFLFGPKSVK